MGEGEEKEQKQTLFWGGHTHHFLLEELLWVTRPTVSTPTLDKPQVVQSWPLKSGTKEDAQ